MNVSDNLPLDTDFGGFAVFGEVVEGFDVVERAALPPEDVWSFPNTPFSELPLIDYTPGDSVSAKLIYVRRVEVVPEAGRPAIVAAALGTLLALRRAARSPLTS